MRKGHGSKPMVNLVIAIYRFFDRCRIGTVRCLNWSKWRVLINTEERVAINLRIWSTSYRQ
jgi:hypothetical protein